MAIAQERLIDLIAISDQAIHTIDNIQELAKKINLNENILLANGAMSHADEPTRETIQHILQSLIMLHDIVMDADVPMADREVIIIERTHFKKHAKLNEYNKHYMKAMRSKNRNEQLSIKQTREANQAPNPKDKPKENPLQERGMYDPDIISISLPTLEEINKPDFPEGSDIL